MNDGRNQRKETKKHLLGVAFMRCVLNTLNYSLLMNDFSVCENFERIMKL